MYYICLCNDKWFAVCTPHTVWEFTDGYWEIPRTIPEDGAIVKTNVGFDNEKDWVEAMVNFTYPDKFEAIQAEVGELRIIQNQIKDLEAEPTRIDKHISAF